MFVEQKLVKGAYVTHPSALHILKVVSLNDTNEAVLSNALLVPVPELTLVVVGTRLNVNTLHSSFVVVGFNNWVVNKANDALLIEQENAYHRIYNVCPFKHKCYPIDLNAA